MAYGASGGRIARPFLTYSIPTKPDSSCHSIRERMENLSEWDLKLLHFLLTLNQRVQGSSPCAPTSKINSLTRQTNRGSGFFGNASGNNRQVFSGDGLGLILRDRITPKTRSVFENGLVFWRAHAAVGYFVPNSGQITHALSRLNTARRSGPTLFQIVKMSGATSGRKLRCNASGPQTCNKAM